MAKQGIYALLGMLALVVLMRVDYRKYNNYPFVVSAISVTTLMLLVVFAMRGQFGAHRWIEVGAITLQPSEIAKPVIVLFLAYFLQKRIHMMDDWKGTILRASLPPLMFIALILKEPDFGTALVCAAVTLLMLYLAGMQLKWIGAGSRGILAGMYYMLWMVPFRRARMEIFFHPELDPLGKGFHTLQSLIAVGTGGFWGRGLMEGIQKLYFLPESHTDFIFSNICEELGLLGALALVGPVLHVRLPRDARGIPVHRSVCALPRIRAHQLGPHSGILQHERRHRSGADQGHYAALHLLWWNLAVLHPGRHGDTAQHHA